MSVADEIVGNAIIWYQYDPTKWVIYALSKVGLTYNLKVFRDNEIQKGRLQQLQKKLDKRRARLDWGLPLSQLPVISWEDFQARCASGEAALVAIAGVIHDITDFVTEHPGGKALIKSAIGKDATALFNGGVYEHSNAAHNLLSTMRVGVLRGGQEVEVWKREAGQPMKDAAGKLIVRAGEQVTRIRPLAASAAAA
jgi:stearoyl-CoA desaturase (delta-9 desaturase)